MSETFTHLSPDARPAFAWETQDLNVSGAVGNASAADAGKGREVIEAAADGLAALLDDVDRFDISRLVTA